MNKRELPVLSVILYVIGGLVAIFAVCATINAADVIVASVNAGQISVSNDFSTILIYFVSGAGIYFIYSLLLFAAGRIMQYSATAANRACQSGGDKQQPDAAKGGLDDRKAGGSDNSVDEEGTDN